MNKGAAEMRRFKKTIFSFIILLMGLHFWLARNLSCQPLHAAFNGFKYGNNYTKRDYKLPQQNWAIVQDQRGIIYVGNNIGLLEFDGVSWRKIDIPNYSVRSMAIDDTGTIYIGGENEMGFLAPDSKGTLQYVTLVNHLKDNQRDFFTVWKTYAAKEGIYFQTSKFLFRWNPNSKQINVWKPDLAFMFSFMCEGKLFIQQDKVGLMQMVNDSLTLVPGGDAFAEKWIYMMVPYRYQSATKTGKLLIGTRAMGFFLYDGKAIIPFPTQMDAYLKEKKFYYGTRLSSPRLSGAFALATLKGGLVIIDSQGRLKDIFTKEYGLQDNNVKYVFEDAQSNIWLALNKGISKIEYASPISVYDDRSNLPGIVLSVVRHGPHNDLYAGTTEGLYFLASMSPGKFRPHQGISNTCWSLLSMDGSILAATAGGVFLLRNNIKQQVIKNGSYVLLQSQRNPNRVWVGTREGLFALYFHSKNRQQNGQWKVESQFADVTSPIQTIVEDNKGKLWLGTKTVGVLKIEFPVDGEMIDPMITRYHTSHGLPAGEVHVFIAAGHVMFTTTGNGIFRFDEQTEHFVPDFTLGNEFAGGPMGVFRIVEDKNKNIWFHSESRNHQAIPKPDGTFVLNSTPFLRVPIVQVNSIYPDPGEKAVWFASHDGLIRYDTTSKKNYRHDFPTLIRKIQVNGKLIFDGCKSKGPIPVFSYEDRNFRFEFAAPSFEGLSFTQFRYFLEGYDKDWSGWTFEPKKDYTNLDPGLYTFRVRSEDVYKNPGSEAFFQFKILPPWYRTWWGFSIYVILAFLLLFLIVKWRSGKLEREKQNLEQIVQKRTNEIKAKNLRLEMQTSQLKEQSEKLRETDKVKSRFFANISHEFRTPLTLIVGPLEQVLDDYKDKNLAKNINLALRNSQRLLNLINQLLDLSKLDSAKMKLQVCEQNMVPFLKGLVDSYDYAAAQNQLALTFHAEQPDITLYFDPEKMEKVLGNLLINALKFTPPGGKITVAARIKQIPGNTDAYRERFPSGYVEISVSDTGTGVPPELMDRIFDRFYQVEELRGHAHKGSGIGLALTKELVSLHHGTIDVYSSQANTDNDNSGTEFVIRLPRGNTHLEPAEIVETIKKTGECQPPSHPRQIPTFYIKEKEENAFQSGSETGTKAMGDQRGETEFTAEDVILVVEDNADVRQFIRGALEPHYRVIEAKDGKEGIDMAKQFIPDLVISDIMMPGADGYELCRVLKQLIPTSHIPIILLTAKASEESIVEGLETGADDYITKPFNTKILLTRIKNLIDLRRQLQEKIQRQMMLRPVEISVSSIDREFMKNLQGTIEKNLSDPEFSIDDLAETLYMSRASLDRKIRALTGESPNRFIRSYRLKRAAQLLKDKFGNVTDVAYEAGFSSSAYFTKCFKEKFHQLPSHYQASESQ